MPSLWWGYNGELNLYFKCNLKWLKCSCTGSVIMFIKNTVDISEQNICNGKHSKNKYIHNYNKLFFARTLKTLAKITTMNWNAFWFTSDKWRDGTRKHHPWLDLLYVSFLTFCAHLCYWQSDKPAFHCSYYFFAYVIMTLMLSYSAHLSWLGVLLLQRDTTTLATRTKKPFN